MTDEDDVAFDLKKAMNGSPVPNWAKLVALGILIGVQACIVWFGQREAVETLVAESRFQAYKDSVAMAEVLGQIRATNLKLDRGYRLGNQEHRRLWKALGRPENARDME